MGNGRAGLFEKGYTLIIKINLLEKMMAILSQPSDIQVLLMLSTNDVKGGGRIPMDARLLIRFLNAPDYFLGMQIQISMNSVQGTFYPYLYCVLIAKREMTLFEKGTQWIHQTPSKIVFEKKRLEDVEVLVIHQKTTRNSGYHTNLKAADRIVQTSLDLARKLLKGCQPNDDSS